MSVAIKHNMYTTGVQVVSGTSQLKNKSKFKGIGVDSADAYRLKWNANGTIMTVPSTVNAPVASGGTTRTLAAADSGSINLFDSAAGITYTLPATPVAGQNFEFIWTVTQTSSNHVVTAGAGIFLLGAVGMFSGEDVTPSATLGPKMFAGNGTTHIKVTMNGTTTGGGAGSWLRFRALSATQWFVYGIVKSPSGSIATIFST
jgi:hypothetical protein